MTSQESSSLRTSTKLKFGIDRLLSTDVDINKTRIDGHFITKPQPTVAVPCSDCVTSLFRCCTLNSTTISGHEHHHHHHHHNSHHHHHHQTLIGQQHRLLTPSSSSIYTIQPIRPFATRPGNYY